MSQADDAYVETIKGWLAGYREDVKRIRSVMLSDAPSPRARYTLAGTLNYQIRKMDLAPDWTPEIGMVDDVMVLRTGAAVFNINNLLDLPQEVAQTIEALAGQDAVVKEILGEDHHDRLFRHVRGLIDRRIHGRTPKEIVEDDSIQKAFLAELDRYLDNYKQPEVGEPEPFMRKVRSYIGTKLG